VNSEFVEFSVDLNLVILLVNKYEENIVLRQIKLLNSIIKITIQF